MISRVRVFRSRLICVNVMQPFLDEVETEHHYDGQNAERLLTHEVEFCQLPGSEITDPKEVSGGSLSITTNVSRRPLISPIQRRIWSLPTQLQQYRSMQLSHTPLRSIRSCLLDLSTTAHARHAGHNGSFFTPSGIPCVAISNVWESMLSISSTV